MRFLLTPVFAASIAILLFWLMYVMTAPPEVPLESPSDTRIVEIVQPPEEEEEEEPEPEEILEAAAAPPSTPPSPSDIDLPDTLTLSAETETTADLQLPKLNLPVKFGGSSGLGDAFGGFGGQGSGTGAGGFGKGRGFTGKRLVPISTGRPQIPEIAFEQGIEGWVEVVFVVLPNGTVENIRIIDAQPKGVFEAAAVEGVSSWLYAAHPRAREVKQKVYFRLEDFKFNWNR
ncbi:energy transducer TonB [bacterium]|nr:energy transducer TonB [bacterium]